MAEVEREFIHERTLVGLDTAAANGKHGGRPPAADGDVLAVALRRRDAKESVTTIASHLGVGAPPGSSGVREDHSTSISTPWSVRVWSARCVKIAVCTSSRAASAGIGTLPHPPPESSALNV
ncbi:hypothetical protein [Streptomyces sp. ICC4]|nr:hypothetical protein [Streptomyces sp. ICC4]